jgi:hypothetical protein
MSADSRFDAAGAASAADAPCQRRALFSAPHYAIDAAPRFHFFAAIAFH